jgi:hypothetical protein
MDVQQTAFIIYRASSIETLAKRQIDHKNMAIIWEIRIANRVPLKSAHHPVLRLSPIDHLLAVTILIGPNRSTTIGLPLASLPCTP